MIDVSTMTPIQIQQTGMEILIREMGPVGFIRFLQQFGLGHGDYTSERQQWLDDLSVDEVLTLIKDSENA